MEPTPMTGNLGQQQERYRLLSRRYRTANPEHFTPAAVARKRQAGATRHRARGASRTGHLTAVV
jgi:hypothetical protein